jgi:hypothetical protein
MQGLSNRIGDLAFAFYRESQTITRAEKKTVRHAVCTKHLSRVTALPKLLFDKQLAAFGQLQNIFGSLNPADSKCIGLDTQGPSSYGCTREKGQSA